MKQQRDLTEMATELTRQLKSRKDYVANSAALQMVHGLTSKEVKITGINGEAFGLTGYAHGQVASSLNIPKKYYDRMREFAPALLAENVNNWMKAEPDKKRMLRTLDGHIRAVLSSHYRPLDNYDLAETVLPVLQENGCEVRSSALTETRMYIKATLPTLRGEVGVGDAVEAGIVISNSEIGAGAVKIEPMIHRLVCLNGMIAPDKSLRKYHVGKGADADGVMELLTTEARQADDRAFWLKVRDIVRGAFSKEVFENLVHKMRISKGIEIQNPNLPEVIEVMQEKYQMTDGVKNSVLTHLVKGGDLTQYGLMNSVTRASQDVEDYDEATELERLGGRILELKPAEWKEIAA